MNIKIENLNIQNLKIDGDCENENLTKAIYPHPFLYPGGLHNLILKLLLDSLPSINIKPEKVEEIFKSKAIEINKRLALGIDEKQIKELNIFPPNGKDFKKWLEDLIKTPPFNPNPDTYNIIQPLIQSLANDDCNKFENAAIEIENYYKENLSKVSDKSKFSEVMSVAYHSAKLYSDKTNLAYLLNIENDKEALKQIDGITYKQINKVLAMDTLGMFGTPITAALMSGGAIIMQL